MWFAGLHTQERKRVRMTLVFGDLRYAVCKLGLGRVDFVESRYVFIGVFFGAGMIGACRLGPIAKFSVQRCNEFGGVSGV